MSMLVVVAVTILDWLSNRCNIHISRRLLLLLLLCLPFLVVRILLLLLDGL